MDYAQIQGMATSGINFFISDDGDSASFKKYSKTQGGVDPETGDDIIPSEVSEDIFGVIRDISARDINGETILAGDKRGIFTHDIAINQGDEIDVYGERYRVVDPRPVRPSGLVVAYRPILRRVATYG